MTLDPRDLKAYFGLSEIVPATITPRYNIAPTLDVAAVRQSESGRELAFLRWGLIPAWAKDPKIGYRTLNARAETAHRLPAFRAAFRNRRCIIPADGFYEWEKKSGSKKPSFIRRSDGEPMAFAGLWERWLDPERKAVVESCTILTTEACATVRSLHDRMPVILDPEDFDLWLDPEERNIEKLRALLRPARDGILALHPVSTYVNKTTHEGSKCIEEIRGQQELFSENSS